MDYLIHFGRDTFFAGIEACSHEAVLTHDVPGGPGESFIPGAQLRQAVYSSIPEAHAAMAKLIPGATIIAV